MNKRSLNTGFTLLEMMVVVLIIAIIAAAVAVNVAGDDPQKRIDTIGDKLYRQMLLAMDTALLSGKTIGLQIEQEETESGVFQWQYGWYHYSKKQWQALSKPLTTTQLPNDVTLELLVEDELIEDFSELPTLIDSIEKSTRTSQLMKPEVVISPEGEITDFRVQLTYRDNPATDEFVYRISVDESGQLTAGDHADKR